MKLFLFILLFLIFTQNAIATRPTIEKIPRSRLINLSSFIFSGWPATQEPVSKCANEFKRWWVHKVHKGNKDLEGKVVSIALHNYHLREKAFLFEDGHLNLEQGTSFLYTTQNQDGCFEFTAQGAQDHSFTEPLVLALMADSNDCDAQKRGLEYLIDKMPTDCKSDNDCQVYLNHPMKCSRPYFLNNNYKTFMDVDFKNIEQNAKKACEKDYAYLNDCKKEDVPFHCKENKCSRGYSKEKMKVAVKFVKAVIRSSCAPHDGPSTVVWLSSKDIKGPSFSLNWWGKNHRELLGSKFTFKSHNEKEFVQGFCPLPQGCKQIKKSEITVERNEKNEGHVKFYFETIDQEVFEGVLPISDEQTKHALCG